MKYIVKMDPLNFSIGEDVTVREKVYHGGETVRNGDEVFLWFSETSGGHGLAWQGTVVQIVSRGSKSLSILVHLTKRVRPGSVGISDLAPFRDVRNERPESDLARVLLKHAHNKIAKVRDSTAEFLRNLTED